MNIFLENEALKRQIKRLRCRICNLTEAQNSRKILFAIDEGSILGAGMMVNNGLDSIYHLLAPVTDGGIVIGFLPLPATSSITLVDTQTSSDTQIRQYDVDDNLLATNVLTAGNINIGVTINSATVKVLMTYI